MANNIELKVFLTHRRLSPHSNTTREEAASWDFNFIHAHIHMLFDRLLTENHQHPLGLELLLENRNRNGWNRRYLEYREMQQTEENCVYRFYIEQMNPCTLQEHSHELVYRVVMRGTICRTNVPHPRNIWIKKITAIVKLSHKRSLQTMAMGRVISVIQSYEDMKSLAELNERIGCPLAHLAPFYLNAALTENWRHLMIAGSYACYPNITGGDRYRHRRSQ